MNYKSIALSLCFCVITLGGILGGCSGQTAEFIAANDAYQKGDYATAKAKLEKELARNKYNYQAWYLLGSTKKGLGDVQGMLEAYSIAEKGVSEEYRTAISNARYSTWSEMYFTAVDMYNKIAENNTDTSAVVKAIGMMNNAVTIKPDMPENYSLRGMLYEAKGDTLTALDDYKKYYELQTPAISLAKTRGIHLGMKRDKALDIIGNSNTTKGYRNANDSLLVDVIYTQTDTVYISSMMKDKSGFIVEGWRTSLPSNWTNLERTRYATINTRPFSVLGSTSYNKKDFEGALKYIDVLSVLKPSDEQALDLKIQAYQYQGKLDEAIGLLSTAVQQDPKNKFYLSNYGKALFMSERYDDAIVQYEKALALDPEYDVALFNAAAALKNRAAQLAKEERDRKEKEPKYRENEQRFFPLLTKSAEYFDRYRKLSNHRTDIVPFEHIVNIYETVRDKAKLRQIVVELESSEYMMGTNPRYWDVLGGVYVRSNQADRADKAFKKADEVRRNAKN